AKSCTASVRRTRVRRRWRGGSGQRSWARRRCRRRSITTWSICGGRRARNGERRRGKHGAVGVARLRNEPLAKRQRASGTVGRDQNPVNAAESWMLRIDGESSLKLEPRTRPEGHLAANFSRRRARRGQHGGARTGDRRRSARGARSERGIASRPADVTVRPSQVQRHAQPDDQRPRGPRAVERSVLRTHGVGAGGAGEEERGEQEQYASL